MTLGIATRQKFLDLVLDQLGCPYIWGGKGEYHEDPNASARFRVFDCSGLVTYCLHSVGGPDWRQSHNADTLYRELPIATEPHPGDLALYGPKGGPAVHVVINLGGAAGVIVGANGGASDCTTLAIAEQRKARVRMDVRGHAYRPDFIGHRSLSNYLAA